MHFTRRWLRLDGVDLLWAAHKVANIMGVLGCVFEGARAWKKPAQGPFVAQHPI